MFASSDASDSEASEESEYLNERSEKVSAAGPSSSAPYTGMTTHSRARK